MKDNNVEEPVMTNDAEMEEPQVKNYYDDADKEAESVESGEGAKPEEAKVAIYFKQEFKDALLSTIGTLGYDRPLGSPDFSVRVNQLFAALDSVMGQPLTEEQANNFISMVAKAPYNVIADVMKTIQENQSLYFEIK